MYESIQGSSLVLLTSVKHAQRDYRGWQNKGRLSQQGSRRGSVKMSVLYSGRCWERLRPMCSHSSAHRRPEERLCARRHPREGGDLPCRCVLLSLAEPPLIKPRLPPCQALGSRFMPLSSSLKRALLFSNNFPRSQR